MDLSKLTVGVNVDIQRTDGRIHSAVVSNVNPDAKSVTVEWYEKGETKGKEIEIEAIYSLNPDLAPKENVPPQRDSHSARSNRQPESNGGGEGTPRPVRVGSARSRQSYATNRPPIQQNGKVANVEPSVPGKVDLTAAGRRKSNCVKEVEKIELRRKERRAAQLAIKEHVEQEYDTSDPNWEFLAMIKEYRAQLDFRPLTSSDPIVNHQICVCVRKRPLNRKELGKRDVDVITVPNKENVIVHEPKLKVDLTKYLENQNFRFDYAFDENSTNEMVYRYTAKPLVECLFDGGMATCFAYGQTGSGKTHTMGGDFSGKGQQDCAKGIYCLAARDVFKLLHSKYKKTELTVGASFFEIYSGKVFDLLNKKLKLRVLEDHKQQVQVVGLKEETIESADDVLRLISHGNNVRTSGTTSANQHSSRSHAVFQIILRKKATGKLYGKFSLIDLAGNERGQDTISSDRQTRMEGAEINKSLLALKECIRALGRKQGAHLPFRASKLTQVLRDSFIGDNSRTCMISMISPGMSCCEHTLNTLRYADSLLQQSVLTYKSSPTAKNIEADLPAHNAMADRGLCILQLGSTYKVKELGPGGPVEGKPAEVALPDNYNMGTMSPQNSALQFIKNKNQEEVTDELLTFHEVVNHMQEMEEEIIDDHKMLIEDTQKWLVEHKKLAKQTDEVDYDTESYAKQLDALLAKKIQELTALREKVARFHKDMQEEENISKNIKIRKPTNK